jgi:hypothetical protein
MGELDCVQSVAALTISAEQRDAVLGRRATQLLDNARSATPVSP